MQDIAELAGNMDEFTHVMMIEFKMFQLEKVFDIPEIAGDEVIHTNDMVTFGDKAVAEMGSEETRCAGDQYTLFAHGVGFMVFFYFAGLAGARPTLS